MTLVLLGEGTHEPAAGFEMMPSHTGDSGVTYFVGVRRSPEGLGALAKPGVRIVTNMPGRGLAAFKDRIAYRRLSAFGMQRSFAGGCIVPDIAVVTATPPDKDGYRYLGTVNGYLQAALDASIGIIVEEDPSLPKIAGCARVDPARVIGVTRHRPLSYAALSREPDATDQRIADHVASLVEKDAALQLGVGGAIACLGRTLRRNAAYRIVTGAIGASVSELERSGKLAAASPIYASAIVGNDELVAWAGHHPRLEILGSDRIHNPRWLARIPRLWSINVGISIDFLGNINSEYAGERLVSGRGGAPNFAAGAHHSPGGAVVVIVRAGRPGTLVEGISRPTIRGDMVDFVVTENGVAELRGTAPGQRRARLERVLA